MPERSIGICPQTEDKCNYKKDTRECKILDFQVCRDFGIISGSANKPLVNEISTILGAKIPDAAGFFADKELKIQIPESVRGKNVYIIETGQPDPNTRVMEACLMTGAAFRASAVDITVIFTYVPYARQDRKDRSRVPISAADVLTMLKACGATRVITYDIHAEQEQGFFHGPADNLYTSYVLIPELIKDLGKNLIIGSPDAGGVRRANSYNEMLNALGTAVAPKIRDPEKDNEPTSLGVSGNVEGKDVLIVDDTIHSAKTLIQAALSFKKAGAERIYASAPHSLLLGNALKRIEDSPIEMVYVTNSVEQRQEVIEHPKIKIISLAPLVASTICRTQSFRSLDELILKTNDSDENVS